MEATLTPDRRETGFHFDKSINLGNVITLIGVILTLIAVSNQITGKIAVIETKVDTLWSQFIRTSNRNPNGYSDFRPVFPYDQQSPASTTPGIDRSK